ILPVGLVIADGDELIAPAWLTDGSCHLVLGGIGGFCFFLLLLAGLVLVGINLEKTFRASVGVMRWRIKFMILGLAVLFAVRFCTGSQILLSHTLDPRLQ